jgi:ABC-type branched-subunit amino acid transport system ATPase component
MSNGLDLVHVRAGYGAVEALHDVTVRCPMGAIVALLGHNGAGKSTLIGVAAGTVRQRAGDVVWRGRNVSSLAPHERAARGITVVPDDPNVFHDMTVEENLALFADGGDVQAAYAAFPALAGRGAQRAGTLSGGERQMLALACLVLRPGDAILVDELSHGLSAAALDRVYGVLGDLAGPARSIVVVEQYQTDILRRADFVYVLSRGEVEWAGERSELTRGLPLALSVH